MDSAKQHQRRQDSGTRTTVTQSDTKSGDKPSENRNTKLVVIGGIEGLSTRTIFGNTSSPLALQLLSDRSESEGGGRRWDGAENNKRRDTSNNNI